MSNLNKFHANERLKQATYTFLASQLALKKDKETVSAIFRAMDENGDGSLSKEEVKNGYF